jgi:hypothetical protein
MLRDIMQGKVQFNNSQEISSSKLKSFVKKIYYLIMTITYSICGRFID